MVMKNGGGLEGIRQVEEFKRSTTVLVSKMEMHSALKPEPGTIGDSYCPGPQRSLIEAICAL